MARAFLQQWPFIQYENPKPLQTAVGPLVQSGSGSNKSRHGASAGSIMDANASDKRWKKWNVITEMSRFGFASLALAVVVSLPAGGASVPPDLTRGETNGVDRAGTYNRGATGLRGWI